MGNKVFVGGLSWDATDDDLKELFGECGTVTDGVILQAVSYTHLTLPTKA